MTNDMAEIWADLLARETVEAEDDFFQLGGDSLVATLLAAIVEERFGVALQTVDVFRHPRLDAFVEMVAERAAGRDARFQEGAL